MRIAKIALAVAGTLVAGSVFAQSATVYGIVDTWIGSDKNGLNASSVGQMGSGGLSGSRWGIKGSEDLGSGLKANFMLEQGFSSDTGSAAAGFGRQAWVGLSGGFGEVAFGNVYTAYDDIHAASNAVFDWAVSPAAYAFVSGNYKDKPKNAMRYSTPDFGGFSGALSYSLDEKNPATNDKTTAFALKYANGPLAVNFGYQRESEPAADTRIWNLNGSYDLGVVKLLATYADVDVENGGDSRDYQLGIDVPMGAVTLSASYADSRTKQAGATTRDADAVGLAVKYDLSKRTNLYAVYTNGDEKTNGVKSDERRIYAVGVRHTF